MIFFLGSFCNQFISWTKDVTMTSSHCPSISEKFEPGYFQICSSFLGGIESIQMVVLSSDTIFKRVAVLDWWDYHVEQFHSRFESVTSTQRL